MRRPILSAAVALALGTPLAALAQAFEPIETIPWPYLGRFPAYPAETEGPTTFWAQAGLLRDTNVFRLSDGANVRAITGQDERGDTIMRFGAGVRHQQRVVGRQSVRLLARGDLYNFQNYGQMDHFAYQGTAEWLWELTNDFSGTIGWDHRKRLIDLAQIQRPLKVMITENHAYANGGYRLGPNFRLRAGVDGVRQQRSDDPDAAGRVRANSITGGIDYTSTLANAIGLEFRRTEGNQPRAFVFGGPVVDDEFEEREAAIVTTWTVTQQIRLNGRVGRTEREHEQVTVRDFDGTTWNFGVDWTPLNKTGFTANWYKAPRTVIDFGGSSFVLARGFTMGPRWAPTEKLVFQLTYSRERQSYSDVTNPAFGPFPLDETARIWRLGAGWEPVRHWEISAGVERGERSSNGLLRDYKFNQYMANARYRF